MIEEIINSFPEPFKSATKIKGFDFDYKVEPINGVYPDHEFLEKHGYKLEMAHDCAYYVNGLRHLNASSYGDWGTVYSNIHEGEETFEGYNKSFCVFCEMYKEGIIKLWRIRFCISSIEYEYDDETKIWRKTAETEPKWVICENPLLNRYL